ncbi:uncharacterized protein [Ptychodera flava]|uniref:uncharacterized protein isoform X1 n=1 Tax=Ptychodera flava TaxID=63121 RepID=UPI00396A8E61
MWELPGDTIDEEMDTQAEHVYHQLEERSVCEQQEQPQEDTDTNFARFLEQLEKNDQNKYRPENFAGCTAFDDEIARMLQEQEEVMAKGHQYKKHYDKNFVRFLEQQERNNHNKYRPEDLTESWSMAECTAFDEKFARMLQEQEEIMAKGHQYKKHHDRVCEELPDLDAPLSYREDLTERRAASSHLPSHTMEENKEYYIDLSKRVEMPRYQCPCRCQQPGPDLDTCARGDTTADQTTEFDFQNNIRSVSGINVTEEESSTQRDTQGNLPEQTSTSQLEMPVESVSAQNTLDVVSKKTYSHKCTPAISFVHVAKAMGQFGQIPEEDLKCLKFCNSLIKEISKHGGEKVWHDATLAVYGSTVTMKLTSGQSETNQFEVAMDHANKPLHHCVKRGLRLQIWDGIVMAIEVSKTTLPVIVGILPRLSTFVQLIKKFKNLVMASK